MQRRVDKADAFVGQNIAVGSVCELRLVVRFDVLEKTRQLSAVLVRDVADSANVEITAANLHLRCHCETEKHNFEIDGSFQSIQSVN